MTAMMTSPDNPKTLLPCTPGSLAFRAAQALAWAVSLFRPLQQIIERTYETAPDGTEVETEIRVPALFVDQTSSPAWKVLAAWVERDDSEACLNVRVLGYWVEVFFIHKKAKR